MAGAQYVAVVPRRDLWTYVGLAAFFALLFVALFGERIAPHEAIYFVPEHGRDPRPYDPGLVFPLGSDVLGRDLLSLVLVGARTTLAIVVLGGIARVLLGLLAAMAAALSRPARVVLDGIAELTAAVPATLIVLLVVLMFVRGDTTPLVFIAALLVTGWAGPYRVARLELDRLARAQFTDAAAAMGLRRGRILVRHHVPHLVPSLAVTLGQQTVASLVALAELGVLAVFVGAVRSINIEESLSVVRTGATNSATLADPPEWGGLLANARSTDNLWVTRWVFLVPGVAFALAAVAIAAIAVALSRRYARRDFYVDLRSRGAALLLALVVAMFVISAVLPERYAAASTWASDARTSVVPASDVETAFRDAGLALVGGSYVSERDVAMLRESAPATVRVNDVQVSESAEGPFDALALLFERSGGGHVDAPAVFASWGLSPADYLPRVVSIFGAPDLGETLVDWPDDYASVDVRGKVAVILRPMAILAGGRTVGGPDPQSSVTNAIKRGAAAVLFVDPTLAALPRVSTPGRTNLYERMSAQFPIERIDAPPVVVLSVAAADRLLAPAGITPSRIYDDLDQLEISTGSAYAKRSSARALGTSAVVDVRVERATAHPRTVLGEIAGVTANTPRIVVWGVVRGSDPASNDVRSILASLARALAPRGSPFIFVAFDPSVDDAGNAALVHDRLAGRDIAMIIVLDRVRGSRFHLTSPMGQYIPAFDTYADKAGARHDTTRTTVTLGDNSSYVWPGIRPFADAPSALVTGAGPDGDLRADLVAWLAYLAGRMALGAEEAPR